MKSFKKEYSTSDRERTMDLSNVTNHSEYHPKVSAALTIKNYDVYFLMLNVVLLYCEY